MEDDVIIVKSKYPAIFVSILFISIGVIWLSLNFHIKNNGIKTTAEIIGFSGDEKPCPIVKFTNQHGDIITETLAECPGRLFKTRKKWVEISYIKKDDKYLLYQYGSFVNILAWFSIFAGSLIPYSMLLDYYKPEWSEKVKEKYNIK